jgi:hypothetical protein
MDARHVNSLSASLSTSGRKVSADRGLVDRGIPKYFTGKGASWHSMCTATAAFHVQGQNYDFNDRFSLRVGYQK